MTFKELADKKVLGVPVLYLAAGFVTILAVVAWRMKSVSTTDTDGIDPADGTAGAEEEASNALAGMESTGAYSGYTTGGTVVVTPTPTDTEEDATPAITDNDAWVKAGSEWLVAKSKATGTEAYAALNKYVSGEDRTYDENTLVNLVIAEKGQPPEGVGKIGIVTEAPSKKQFTNFPGKHTVRGSNDNTAYRLANLYYGTSGTNMTAWVIDANSIVEQNTGLGPVTTTYPVGTVVNIPAKITPVYKTTTSTYRTFATIASKEGLSQAQVQALNPGLANPAPIGKQVRVR